MLLPLAAVQVRAGQDVRDGPEPAKIVLLNDLETKTSCIKLYIKIETIAAIDDKIFVLASQRKTSCISILAREVTQC